jgi:small subunit ribosomal protein S1
MSLGIKQLSQDPWTDITSKYPVGSKHSGIVRNFTNFGYLRRTWRRNWWINISDLSWTKKIKHPSEFVNVGENDVVVLELDVDGRKLSLGHKQTTANPWDQYEVHSLLELSTTEIWNCWRSYCRIWRWYRCFHSYSSPWKEDGKKLKRETADFKVIEFNKEFKSSCISHCYLPWRRREKMWKLQLKYFI